MNTFATRQNLKPGDVVIVPKSELKIIEHYLIYIRTDINAEDVYAENIVGFGVRLITGTQFARENPKYLRIRRLTGNDYEKYLAVQRAYSLIGKKYSLVGFNCEDYANYVQYNKAFSQQTNWAAGFATVLGVALLLGAVAGGGRR